MTRVLFPLLLLLAAVPAAAQRVTSPYRFLEHPQHAGAFVGYLSSEEGVLRAGPQPAPTFGVHWGYAISGPIKLTAEVALTPTKRTVRDTAFVEADSTFRAVGEADITLLSLLGNVRLDLTGQRTWYGLQPFLIGGAGAVIDVAGTSELEEETPANQLFNFGTSFAGQLGAGVEWYPSSRVSLRADARSLLWKLSVPEGFRLTGGGRRLAGSEWEMNMLVALGVSVHF